MIKYSSSLPKLHPATIIVTWFYSGLSPFAPGTLGSLCAIPFAWFIVSTWGNLTLLSITCFLFFVGWILSFWALKILNDEDPACIVIDEVVGQWLVLVIVPQELFWYALAFVLFRIADIAKPWPVSTIDKKIKNALGVMLDDVSAGIYALGMFWLIYSLFRWT